MRQCLLLASGFSAASASTLASICSTSNIQNSLPSSSDIDGLIFRDVTAQAVYNSSVEAGNNYPAATGRNFCNVTVAYKHAGKDDAVGFATLDLFPRTHVDDESNRSTFGTTSLILPNTKVASLPRVAEASPSILALPVWRVV